MPSLDVDKEVPYFLQNTDESGSPEEAEFTGKIPSWLIGKTMLSIGPGIYDLPNGSFNHYIDALALLVRIEIKESSINISKRFLQSEAYKNAIKEGKPCSVEFGTNPSMVGKKKGFFSKLKPFTFFDSSDNCFGRIVQLGPKNFYAMSEVAYFFKINPHSLETLERKHLLKTLGLASLNQEPLIDPDTGDMYFIGATPTLRYNLIRVKAGSFDSIDDKDDKISNHFETLCTISPRWYGSACVLKCFGMTKNYLIFVEQPIIVNSIKYAATNVKSYCVKDWLEFKEEELCRFFIVEKQTGKLFKDEIYSDKMFLSMNVINAFEDGDEDEKIIFDCITMPDMESIDKCSMVNLRNCFNSSFDPPKTLSTIARFVIPLKRDLKSLAENVNILQPLQNLDSKTRTESGTEAVAIRKGNAIFLTPKIHSNLKELGMDFGQINNSMKGKPYKYFFGIPGAYSIKSKYHNTLCKVNMNTGEIEGTWEADKKENGLSEIAFIVDPNATTEDEGVLIFNCASRRKDGKNYIVFLDGKSFQEIGRCYYKMKLGYWFNPTVF